MEPNNIDNVQPYVASLIVKIMEQFGDATPENAIMYCIERGIIRRTTLRNFMICEDYPYLLNQEGSKIKALEIISKKYGVEVRQLYNILQYQLQTHRKGYNLTH